MGKAGKASQEEAFDWAWLRFRYKEIEGNLFLERKLQEGSQEAREFSARSGKCCTLLPGV